MVVMDGEKSERLWRGVRDAEFVAEPAESAVWRISTAPTRAPALTAAIGAAIPEARWFYDWGGGLIWLSLPAGADAGAATVRAATAQAGGHATLIRAPREVRAAVAVFQPLGPLHGVTDGVKASFDPGRIFEPGRMYAGV
jgi:glycolate oxidase FAD binding subunit